MGQTSSKSTGLFWDSRLRGGLDFFSVEFVAQTFCVLCVFFGSNIFGSNMFGLKHTHIITDGLYFGSQVGVGCAVATRVSEPPRGCRWETDCDVQSVCEC